jgi:starch phosphorylase
MARARKLEGAVNGHEYDVRVPATRPAGDYTPGLIPYHPAAAVPLENWEIAWQR